MNESESEYDSNSEYETDSEFEFEFESETESEYETDSEYEYETYSELSGITSSELSDDDDESIYHLEQTNTEDDLLELEVSVYENIDWYINEFAINYSNPNFHEQIVNDITQLIIIGGIETGLFDDLEDSNDSIRNFVEKRITNYFDTGIAPLRSYPIDYIQPKSSQEDQEKITQQLTHLLELPVQIQRTPEWYATRYRLLTASNIYKIFGSQCLYNSFILEKCKPLLVPIPNETECHSVNTESPMHHGVRFEPLSQRIYEILYSPNQPISEFGCIQHPEYSCIGASPDGINMDEASNHYGNMIEIKNIFNREITGIPSEAYWTQVQLQLEVCKLPMCDFVETRFKQYENENAFWMEDPENLEGGVGRSFRGVILYFVHKTALGSTPYYVYHIVDSDSYYKIKHKKYTEDWINEQKTILNEYSLYETIYWYLDEISVIMIPRNKLWFSSAIPAILDTWKVIEYERVSGYSHRLPRKTNKIKQPICVIKLE